VGYKRTITVKVSGSFGASSHLMDYFRDEKDLSTDFAQPYLYCYRIVGMHCNTKIAPTLDSLCVMFRLRRLVFSGTD
jgi:hypothetical protein